MQVILQWCTSEEEFTLVAQSPYQLGELTFLVLDLMGFVDYDVVPFNIFKVIQADPNSLETCDQDIEFLGHHAVGQDLRTLLFGSDEFDNHALWQPFFKLIFPIPQSNLRRDNYMGSFHLFKFA